MRAADELQGPVSHDPRWWWLVLGAFALVAVYYAAVLWWTRARPDRPVAAASAELWLGRLDDIAGDVRDGRLTAREGHQQVSRVVREFVADRSGLPATTMTLTDLRRRGPDDLAEVVSLVYPPAFSADNDLPDRVLDDTMTRARALVSTW